MGVSLSKRARVAWLVAIAAMVVFTWLSRATASGFPDQTGWVAMMMFAVVAVDLLRTSHPRPQSSHHGHMPARDQAQPAGTDAGLDRAKTS